MSLKIALRVGIFPRFFEQFTTVCLFLLAAQALAAQQAQENARPQYVIERIDLMGNRGVETETVQTWISSRPGDPYSAEVVRRDVRALWKTQFFDDVRVEVEDSPHRPDAKIVIFSVIERPIIQRIEYKGIKSITESDILDAFKDKKVGLSVGSPFDREKALPAARIIKGLLAAHGHPFAVVKPTYERNPSANEVTLVFNVDEGPRGHSQKQSVH